MHYFDTRILLQLSEINLAAGKHKVSNVGVQPCAISPKRLIIQNCVTLLGMCFSKLSRVFTRM